MFYFQKEENKYGEKQMKNWAENRNLVLKHFDIVVHWTTYYYLLTFIFLWSMRDWGTEEVPQKVYKIMKVNFIHCDVPDRMSDLLYIMF